MKKKKLTYYALPFIMGPLLWGCSAHNDVDLSAAEDGEITIVIRLPRPEGISRANPVGGEDGNGREEGILNENNIYDINVFFYQGSGINLEDGVNPAVTRIYVAKGDNLWTEDDTNPFEKKIVLKLNPETTSLPQSGLLNSDVSVSFITVVNGGEDCAKDVQNLSELRAYKDFSNTWTSTVEGSFNASDCDRFVMTTAYETNANGEVTIDGSLRKVGSGRLIKNPTIAGTQNAGKEGWSGETTVQRICARIDVMYGDNTLVSAEEDGKKLLYKVKSTSTNPNLVHITNILPVNMMLKPSYLLTKVTGSVPTTWSSEADLGHIKWAGVETTGSNKWPSNYFVEPLTLTKSTTQTSETLTTWYGESASDAVKDLIKDTSKGLVGKYYSGELAVPEYDGSNHTTIIGYSNENIQGPDQYNSDYLTGLVFKAVFQPRIICTVGDNGNLNEYLVSDEEWSALSDSQKSFVRYQPTRKDGTTLAIVDDKAIYFKTIDEANTYSHKHPEQQAIITSYTNGVCYYNLWLRHYNDVDDKDGSGTSTASDPHAKLPMEYAIVRNNIYRVALTFSGPGTPEPELRETDTMMSRIFVRKWNQRTEKNPLQF